MKLFLNSIVVVFATLVLLSACGNGGGSVAVQAGRKDVSQMSSTNSISQYSVGKNGEWAALRAASLAAGSNPILITIDP